MTAAGRRPTWDQVLADNPGLTAEVTSDGMLCRAGSRTFLASSPDDAASKLARPGLVQPDLGRPMVPAPGAPVVVTLNCRCGAVIQRAEGHRKPGDEQCYQCSPDTLAERTRMQAKADRAVADLAASVRPSGSRDAS